MSTIFILLLLYSSFSVGLPADAVARETNPFSPKAFLKRYWDKKITNNLPKPSFLLSKASPLSAVDTATFAKLAATNALSTRLHEFCSAAHLLCSIESARGSGKHNGNGKFAVYGPDPKNFTNYGSGQIGGGNSFKNYSHNDFLTPSQNDFRRYSRGSTEHKDDFSSYASGSNEVHQDFQTYGTGAMNGAGEFKQYIDSVNDPHLRFTSYSDDANARTQKFSSCTDGSNSGDQAFHSYGKNGNGALNDFHNYVTESNVIQSNFTNYGETGNGGIDKFKNYGNQMNVPEANKMPDIRDKMPERSFLPRSILSQLPLSSSKISELKQIFKTMGKVANDSSMENVITSSLRECERAASQGETKRCVGSIEDMIDFTTSVLGRDVVVRTTENVNGSKKTVMVGSIKRINGGRVTKSVSCHQSLFPYLLYYCHSVPKVRVYEADLLDPSTKVKINLGTAICHLDTSAWSPAHGAFLALGPGPGRIEVCHWIFQNDMTWTTADRD